MQKSELNFESPRNLTFLKSNCKAAAWNETDSAKQEGEFKLGMKFGEKTKSFSTQEEQWTPSLKKKLNHTE